MGVLENLGEQHTLTRRNLLRRKDTGHSITVTHCNTVKTCSVFHQGQDVFNTSKLRLNTRPLNISDALTTKTRDFPTEYFKLHPHVDQPLLRGRLTTCNHRAKTFRQEPVNDPSDSHLLLVPRCVTILHKLLVGFHRRNPTESVCLTVFFRRALFKHREGRHVCTTVCFRFLNCLNHHLSVGHADLFGVTSRSEAVGVLEGFTSRIATITGVVQKDLVLTNTSLRRVLLPQGLVLHECISEAHSPQALFFLAQFGAARTARPCYTLCLANGSYKPTKDLPEAPGSTRHRRGSNGRRRVYFSIDHRVKDTHLVSP